MPKTKEDVKKEFNTRIFVIGNKLSFIYVLINYILFALYVLLVKQYSINISKSTIFIVFTTNSMIFLLGFLYNVYSKWKSEYVRYICIIVPIISNCVSYFFTGDSDALLFLISCIAISVIYLDSNFSIKVGCTEIVGIAGIILLKYFMFHENTAKYYFWTYYYSISNILVFTIFVVMACKLIRSLLLEERIAEFENEKIKKDNMLASRIQEGFLNGDFPSNDVYDINACMIPSKNVGGDFYDFYMIDSTRLAMTIADVSGKGIPAALLMANAKTVIKNNIMNGISFEKSLEKANREIFCENKELQFITVFICIVDLTTGKMNYINAGHVKPFVLNKDGNTSVIVSKPDFIFGVRKDVRYHSNEYMLKPGDRLFICTDGVTERLDIEDKLYGKDRVIQFLNKNSNLKASEIISNLLNSLDEFSKGREQNDDITGLLFNYKKEMVLEPAITCSFDVANDKTSDIINGIKEILVSKNVPEKIVNRVAVASDEIISNICKFAYDGIESEKSLTISIKVYNRKIKIVYIDYGKYFNPLIKIAFSGTTKVTDKSKIGGLGIQLTWNIMDNVIYNRIDDKNMITIEKEY